MDEARARDVLAAAGLPGRRGRAAARAGRERGVRRRRPGRQGGPRRRTAGRGRERELAVAAWLAEAGVPAVRAAEPEARLVEGHPVTVWHRLPDAVRPAGAARTWPSCCGWSTPCPPLAFALPRRELLGGVERWLRLAGDAIDPADAAYLRERRDGFAAAAAALTPHLPPGPIHGDALPRNVHVGPDGPVLVDLETFSADLREHDLVVMALSRDRYGLARRGVRRRSRRRTAGTCASGTGCAVLRGARETASCAWVAQHAPSEPEGAGGVRAPGGVTAGRGRDGALVPVLSAGLDGRVEHRSSTRRHGPGPGADRADQRRPAVRPAAVRGPPSNRGPRRPRCTFGRARPADSPGADPDGPDRRLPTTAAGSLPPGLPRRQPARTARTGHARRPPRPRCPCGAGSAGSPPPTRAYHAIWRRCSSAGPSAATFGWRSAIAQATRAAASASARGVVGGVQRRRRTPRRPPPGCACPGGSGRRSGRSCTGR